LAYQNDPLFGKTVRTFRKLQSCFFDKGIQTGN